ncbi:hypothetical protein Ddc_11474 [Ditylenchus destructor]|nr:hypothetical protein Ddc_11474 [Ditylenchus destructor]
MFMLSASADKVSLTFILKMLTLRTIVLILAVISITLAFRLKSSPNQNTENDSTPSDISVDNTSECRKKIAYLSRIYGFRDHLILTKIDPGCHSSYYRSKQNVLRRFHKIVFGDLLQFEPQYPIRAKRQVSISKDADDVNSNDNSTQPTLAQCVLCDLVLNGVNFANDATFYQKVSNGMKNGIQEICTQQGEYKGEGCVEDRDFCYLLDHDLAIDSVLAGFRDSMADFYNFISANALRCPDLETLNKYCLAPPSETGSKEDPA